MHKIAIVEDDDALRGMYQMKFEQHSFWVETAEDGVSGLSLVKNFRPDLILLDITLPVLTGIEMLEKLFSSKRWHHPKIVLFSNHDEEHAAQKYRHLKIDRYILKAHHTPRQVAEIVEEVLRNPLAAS